MSVEYQVIQQATINRVSRCRRFGGFGAGGAGEDEAYFQAAVFGVFGGEFGIVLFGNVFGDGQPQAGAAGVCAAVGAVERGEDVRKLFGFDAGAVVGDFYLEPPAVFAHGDVDAAAFGAVFHGVADDVVEGAV